ncbi:hypothetical protein TNCV_4131091 [Trichonephila clavipes]|nr:hypothetical protein TNCV_4131091 [Trichonephila clavipes]
MSSKAQRRGSDYRRKRKRFHANQYTRNVSDTLAVDCISASAKKLCKENYLDKEPTFEKVLSSKEIFPRNDPVSGVGKKDSGNGQLSV